MRLPVPCSQNSFTLLHRSLSRAQADKPVPSKASRAVAVRKPQHNRTPATNGPRSPPRRDEITSRRKNAPAATTKRGFSVLSASARPMGPPRVVGVGPRSPELLLRSGARLRRIDSFVAKLKRKRERERGSASHVEIPYSNTNQCDARRRSRTSPSRRIICFTRAAAGVGEEAPQAPGTLVVQYVTASHRYPKV